VYGFARFYYINVIQATSCISVHQLTLPPLTVVFACRQSSRTSTVPTMLPSLLRTRMPPRVGF
jgi:hypothetical protein